MSDTGQEMAADTARMLPHVAERMLEHHFMLRRMERAYSTRQEVTRTDAPMVPDGYACTITVSPANGDGLDLRAHEVLDALERTGAAFAFHVDDGKKQISVSIRDTSLDAAQRALERLQADTRSGFTLSEVRGLDALEAATGHRTLSPWARGKALATGRAETPEAGPLPAGPPPDRHRRAATRDGQTAEAQPDAADATAVDDGGGLTHVTLTFANHPHADYLDRRHAREYAEGMRQRGFDAYLGESAVGRHVVAVSYPTGDEQAFLSDSADVLGRIGALAELLADEPAPPVGHDRERAAGEPTHDAADARGHEAHAPDPAHTARDAHQGPGGTDRDGTRQAREAARGAAGPVSDAEGYLSLGASKRASIPPAQIPDAAFGSMSLAETMAASQVAADALAHGAQAAHSLEHEILERG